MPQAAKTRQDGRLSVRASRRRRHRMPATYTTADYTAVLCTIAAIRRLVQRATPGTPAPVTGPADPDAFETAVHAVAPIPRVTFWSAHLDRIQGEVFGPEARGRVVDDDDLDQFIREDVAFCIARASVHDDLPTLRVLIELTTGEALREAPRPRLFALVHALREPFEGDETWRTH